VKPPAAPPSDLGGELRRLADRLDSIPPPPAQVFGALAAMAYEVLTAGMTRTPSLPDVSSGPGSRNLSAPEVAERIGMSKDWVYHETRAGRLPFARRIGRRVVFDEAALTRWLDRRRLTPKSPCG
jgi:excisionase family DNA binding protein